MNYNDYNFSNHLNQRITDRQLETHWILETVTNPDRKDEIADDEIHCFKFISENFNKCLKVVVNPISKTIVTAHFDRNKTKKGLL